MIDLELIQQCRQGNLDAFDTLYKTYASKALRTAFLVIGRKDLAEDIFQEAFLECFRDIKRLQKPEAFQVWFNRLLIRICWRVAGNERKNMNESLECISVNSLRDNQNVQEIVEQQESIKLIRQELLKLSIPLRTTLILYYYNELPIKDIARVMQCFQGTVKSRLYYGKKMLAKAISVGYEGVSEEIPKHLRKELNYNGHEHAI